MALQGSGSISWTQITQEFGEPIVNGISSLGNYRISETIGGVTYPLDTDAGQNLDTDIPSSNQQISFSNFYNARLNMAVDYYTGISSEYLPDTVRQKFDANVNVVSIGGFKSPLTDPSTSKVVAIINNKSIGGKETETTAQPNASIPYDRWGYRENVNQCSLKTGAFPSGTKLRIEVGPTGAIMGSGGIGGAGGIAGNHNGICEKIPRDVYDGITARSRGWDGQNGLSALGIEHDGTVVNIQDGGKIITGYGGGGGGGGGVEGSAYRRYANGSGGGGGSGLPAGLRGIAPPASGRRCVLDTSTDGNKPDGITETAGDGAGRIRCGFGSPDCWIGCNEDGQNEAVSGGGGHGRDQESLGYGGTTVTQTRGDYGYVNGIGQTGYTSCRRNEKAAGGGGYAGEDGAAIRKTNVSINFTIDGTSASRILGRTDQIGVI